MSLYQISREPDNLMLDGNDLYINGDLTIVGGKIDPTVEIHCSCERNKIKYIIDDNLIIDGGDIIGPGRIFLKGKLINDNA